MYLAYYFSARFDGRIDRPKIQDPWAGTKRCAKCCTANYLSGHDSPSENIRLAWKMPYYEDSLVYVLRWVLISSKISFRNKQQAFSMGNMMMSPELYVNVWSFFMMGYAAQMLLTPAKMLTDHFDAPATPMVKFWIRGQSAGWAAIIYCLYKLDTPEAVKVATALSIAIGVLYPANAKFELFGEKLAPKCKFLNS
jgi:hypothetical protein